MIRYSALAALLVAAVPSALVGCSSSADEDNAQGSAASEGELSYVGEAVIASLEKDFAAEKGRGWSVSRDAEFAPDFSLHTPSASTWGNEGVEVAALCEAGTPNCDAQFPLFTCRADSDCNAGGHCRALKATVSRHSQQPRSMCVGDGDALLDDVWSAIALAKTTIDVTSLTPPKGRFEVAVRNALTYASDTDNPPRARLLFGSFPGSGDSLVSSTDANETLERLTRDIPKASPMSVAVGTYRAGLDSWNHSKIISRDGDYVVSGGTNMWDVHYLRKNPVHDMWITLRGGPAVDASNYIDGLWQYTCKPSAGSAAVDVREVARRGTASRDACDEGFGTTATPSHPGTSSVISVGRYGRIGAAPSDAAIVTMIQQAKTSIRMSQQDLGPLAVKKISPGKWPIAVMSELLAAMGRGVDVRLILSNTKAVPGDVSAAEAAFNTYDNGGWTAKDVFDRFVSIASEQPTLLPRGTNAMRLLCSKLQLMRVRRSDKATWPDGTPIANHVKAVVVDDRAFYLGSQNLYISNLAEFGFIVDDEKATRSFLSSYLDHVEKYSLPTAREQSLQVCPSN